MLLRLTFLITLLLPALLLAEEPGLSELLVEQRLEALTAEVINAEKVPEFQKRSEMLETDLSGLRASISDERFTTLLRGLKEAKEIHALKSSLQESGHSPLTAEELMELYFSLRP